MPDLAKQFTKKEIESALEYILENEIELLASTKHNLVYKDHLFPPKEVVRLYFEANKVVLLYPGEGSLTAGQFYHKDQSGFDNKHCHVLQIPADKDFGVWKNSIVENAVSLLI